MSEELVRFSLELFLVFTRVGTCMMLLPGFSAAQVSPRIRLYIAAVISIAILPQVRASVEFEVLAQDGFSLLYLIGVEMLIGAAFALPVRFFMAALSFLGEVLMQMIGLNPIPGIVGENGQAVTTLSAFFNAAVVTLFFVVGLHAQFIVAVAATFLILPPGQLLDIGDALVRMRDGLSEAFFTVLRLGAPFVILAIAINLVSGIVNKLTPQIPVYFVATPFLIASGLALLYWVGDDILALFLVSLSNLAELP